MRSGLFVLLQVRCCAQHYLEYMIYIYIYAFLVGVENLNF